MIAFLLLVQAFEGALVEEAPDASLLRKGDILLSIGGLDAATLPALRRRVSDSLGRSVTLSIRRQEAPLALEGSLPAGNYRLSEWPTPSERFRQQGRDLTAPGVDDALRALRALEAGEGRTARRRVDLAREAGFVDPMLDWAEAWILLRHENRETAAEKILGAAKRGTGRPIDGLLKRADAWLEAVGHRHPAGALKAVVAARELGADVAFDARDIAASFPPDSKEARSLRALALEDNPLDRGVAELEARHAATEKERQRAADLARRLAPVGVADPRLELSRLVDRAKTEEAARKDLKIFLEDNKELDAPLRAGAWDLLGDLSSIEEQTLEHRLAAFEAAPTAARAKALDRSARALQRAPEALSALRKIYEQSRVGNDALKEIMIVYHGLLSDTYARYGVPVLEESVRLKSLGRIDEAAQFLTERGSRLCLPELAIAAALMRRESGATSEETDKPIGEEERFWARAAWSNLGWVDNYRFCLTAARRGEKNFHLGYVDILDDARPPVPASYRAVQASIYYQKGLVDRGRETLKQAVDALRKGDAARGWFPMYAEGRLCRHPRDYVEALNVRWKAGLSVP